MKYLHCICISVGCASVNRHQSLHRITGGVYFSSHWARGWARPSTGYKHTHTHKQTQTLEPRGTFLTKPVCMSLGCDSGIHGNNQIDGIRTQNLPKAMQQY